MVLVMVGVVGAAMVEVVCVVVVGRGRAEFCRSPWSRMSLLVQRL